MSDFVTISLEDHKRIKEKVKQLQKREPGRWATNSTQVCMGALVAASKIFILQPDDFAENKIPLTTLQDWYQDNKIRQPDITPLCPLDSDCQRVFQTSDTQGCIDQSTVETWIDQSTVETWIDNMWITAANITNPTWRAFNTKDGRIAPAVFKAYWQAIRLRLNEMTTPLGSTLPKNVSRPTTLYRALISFDYADQVDTFDKQIMCQPERIGAILIQGRSHVERTWIMRRLETEIRAQTSRDNLEFKSVSLLADFASGATQTDHQSLEQRIHKEYGQKLSQFLKKKSMILVFKNIDRLGQQDFASFLTKVWQPMVDQVRAERGNSRLPGFFVAFFVDNGCARDWDHTWDKTTFAQMIRVPAVNFTQADFQAGIRDLRRQFQDPEFCKDEQQIATQLHTLFHDSDPSERIRQVLQEFYGLANCRFSMDKRWGGYP